MKEAPENGKESSHSAQVNGMNVHPVFFFRIMHRNYTSQTQSRQT
jgi:hypothetical protein